MLGLFNGVQFNLGTKSASLLNVEHPLKTQIKGNRMINKYGKLALAASALALASVSAQAALGTAQLRLDDGTTVVTITDNDANDTNPLLGAIGVNQTIGVFTVILDTALSKPANLSTAEKPVMSLSFNETSTGAGTLKTSFSDTGFGPSTGRFLTSTGGSSNPPETGETQSFYSLSNTTFDEPAGNLLGQIGPLTGTSWNGDATSAPFTPLTGPYSLTLDLIATHSGAANSSGVATLSLIAVPDGGNTVMLLGSSLALVGFVANRRKQTA
jgi:hypothetical protein